MNLDRNKKEHNQGNMTKLYLSTSKELINNWLAVSKVNKDKNNTQEDILNIKNHKSNDSTAVKILKNKQSQTYAENENRNYLKGCGM